MKNDEKNGKHADYHANFILLSKKLPVLKCLPSSEPVMYNKSLSVIEYTIINNLHLNVLAIQPLKFC